MSKLSLCEIQQSQLDKTPIDSWYAAWIRETLTGTQPAGEFGLEAIWNE